jgi:hypothetical protein
MASISAPDASLFVHISCSSAAKGVSSQKWGSINKRNLYCTDIMGRLGAGLSASKEEK